MGEFVSLRMREKGEEMEVELRREKEQESA